MAASGGAVGTGAAMASAAWDLDTAALQRDAALATRFLDSVVTQNKYVASVPQLREAAEGGRRLGLGIMGLADMLFALRIPYGSRRGTRLAADVMRLVDEAAFYTSLDLADEKGAYGHFAGSRYDPRTWPDSPTSAQLPHPLCADPRVRDRLLRNGLRNCTRTTIAPTGTLATVADCEGYGCEPVFALAYTRYVVDAKTNDRSALTYGSPLFRAAVLSHCGGDTARTDAIIARVASTGSCQHLVDDLPQEIRDVFVVSGDLTADQHLDMQLALQPHVDNSISKTINMPATATVEDVEAAYVRAYEGGACGLTVYVSQSRTKVVLETADAAAAAATAAQSKCDACGEMAMVAAGGCKTCTQCGNSLCE